LVWSPDTVETRTAEVPARWTAMTYVVQHCANEAMWGMPEHAVYATVALLLQAGAAPTPVLLGMTAIAAIQCVDDAATTPQWLVLVSQLVGVLELVQPRLPAATWSTPLMPGATSTPLKLLAQLAASLRGEKRVAHAGSGKASKALVASLSTMQKRLEVLDAAVTSSLATVATAGAAAAGVPAAGGAGAAVGGAATGSSA